MLISVPSPSLVIAQRGAALGFSTRRIGRPMATPTCRRTRLVMHREPDLQAPVSPAAGECRRAGPAAAAPAAPRCAGARSARRRPRGQLAPDGAVDAKLQVTEPAAPQGQASRCGTTSLTPWPRSIGSAVVGAWQLACQIVGDAAADARRPRGTTSRRSRPAAAGCRPRNRPDPSSGRTGRWLGRRCRDRARGGCCGPAPPRARSGRSAARRRRRARAAGRRPCGRARHSTRLRPRISTSSAP